MRKYRKLYIIIVVAYAALLVVSRIYSVSSFLVDIVYLFSWIVILFLEIRKQYNVKKNDKKEEIDYFPIILIFLMMVMSGEDILLSKVNARVADSDFLILYQKQPDSGLLKTG